MSPLAASVLTNLAPFLDLLALHPPRECETNECDAGPISPRLGKMDRDFSASIDSAVFECGCGWVRHEPLVLR